MSKERGVSYHFQPWMPSQYCWHRFTAYLASGSLASGPKFNIVSNKPCIATMPPSEPIARPACLTTPGSYSDWCILTCQLWARVPYSHIQCMTAYFVCGSIMSHLRALSIDFIIASYVGTWVEATTAACGRGDILQGSVQVGKQLHATGLEEEEATFIQPL